MIADRISTTCVTVALSRLPHFDRLSGHGTPAELVDRRVEAHTDRRAEDRAHPENHEPQSFLPAQRSKQLLGL
jgi:hypothetical protein